MAHHDLPNPLHYAPDLLKDRLVMWLNRSYLVFATGGLILPAVVGGLTAGSFAGALSGFLWGGPVRIFVCNNLTWSVNSFCHTFGHKAFPTHDESRNLAWLAIPTFGESWHNNHHAFPSSACNTQKWWQMDLAYVAIWCFARVGLASNVRVVTARSRSGEAITGAEGGGDGVGR
jgi:stearoyl-CoA desaturase (delta-9 desaturase)